MRDSGLPIPTSIVLTFQLPIHDRNRRCFEIEKSFFGPLQLRYDVVAVSANVHTQNVRNESNASSSY